MIQSFWLLLPHMDHQTAFLCHFKIIVWITWISSKQLEFLFRHWLQKWNLSSDTLNVNFVSLMGFSLPKFTWFSLQSVGYVLLFQWYLPKHLPVCVEKHVGSCLCAIHFHRQINNEGFVWLSLEQYLRKALLRLPVSSVVVLCSWWHHWWQLNEVY